MSPKEKHLIADNLRLREKIDELDKAGELLLDVYIKEQNRTLDLSRQLAEAQGRIEKITHEVANKILYFSAKDGSWDVYDFKEAFTFLNVILAHLEHILQGKEGI